MNSRPRQTWIEWGFVLLMAVLCATLTALQYRWTGEVSRAEMTRLRGNLGEQVQLLGREFDSEIADGVSQLLPTGSEIDERGREVAHLERFHQWSSANPRPIFSRIAVAVPERDGLKLYELDQKSEKLVPLEWPRAWSAVQEHLSRKGSGRGGGPGGGGPGGGGPGGGPPSFSDPGGELIEFPVMGGSRRGGGPESEWFILELDLAYARNSWLPELLRSYLNPGGKLLNDVDVKTFSSPAKLLYSTRGGNADDSEPAHVVKFNPQLRFAGPRSGQGESGRWILEARPRSGALEAVVSASRRRNLAVAVGLNGLMLAAALALVRFTRRSRQLAEAQMSFVANVSHELRTPLTVIRGAGHNLLRGVVKERGQVEEYSKLIIDHAEQLKELVEQTLALAGADQGHAALARERVEIPPLLNEAIAAAAEDTQAAQCEVHLESPPALPPVAGDAAALRRVFQNLIANAAKHGGDGHWIGVTAVLINGSHPPTVEVCVSDRGPGIPATEQSEIFKPFFRGAAAQAKQLRGSGLGLSIVREIVGAHGGRVSVESEAGRGTTFTVRLPAGS